MFQGRVTLSTKSVDMHQMAPVSIRIINFGATFNFVLECVMEWNIFVALLYGTEL